MFTMTPRTALGLSHLIVIQAAPADMVGKLRLIASQACLREYDRTGDLKAYLDSEDFYYE